MANLKRQGKIIEVWQNRTRPDKRYHVTENGRVLRTTGPRDGGAKFVRVNAGGGVFVGGMDVGKLASASDPAVTAWLEHRADRVVGPLSSCFTSD